MYVVQNLDQIHQILVTQMTLIIKLEEVINIVQKIEIVTYFETIFLHVKFENDYSQNRLFSEKKKLKESF